MYTEMLLMKFYHDGRGAEFKKKIFEKIHKFHAVVRPSGAIFENNISFMRLFGPPGAFFEKNNNLQNQEEHFSIFKNGFKSRFDSARI